MKQQLLSLLLLACSGFAMLMSGCVRDQCERSITYMTYEPVYMSYDEMRASVRSESPRELKVPGKIYFYNFYIFISEINEGIHVIDNQDPSNPQNIAFIRIPGNHDLAVKGNVLYVDSYIDLVAINIEDLLNVKEIYRREEVFPYYANYNGFVADKEEGVIQSWELVEKTEVLDCVSQNRQIQFAWGCPNCEGGPTPFGARVDATLSNVAATAFTTTNGLPQSGAELPVGVGGSLARFTIYTDFLYAVTDRELLVFDITDVTHPLTSSRINIGWQIETIYPMTDKLFIGSQAGMFIYDLANPRSPSFLSEFQHVRSCDPVVVDGELKYAYVTLRSGNLCPGDNNTLNVIDISELTRPNLVQTYPMFNPFGLGIRDQTLFICDGSAGLKVFDVSDVFKITSNQLAQFDDINALDVIPLNNLLLLIGEDGFYQYDYSDLKDIRLLSQIPIGN